MMQHCNELGSIALGNGDYKEARKQFRYMVRESQKHGEREQAGALNRLGLACMRDRRYEEAEDAFRRCLELSERIYGPTHPETASELNNLAVVLLNRDGNTTKARPLLEKAVQIVEDAMPFSSGFTNFQIEQYVRAFETLAGLLEEDREGEAAEKLYRKALAVKIEASGDSSPAVFRSVNSLSDFLRKQGRIEESSALLNEFLPAIKRFAHSVNNPELNTMLQLMDRIGPSNLAEASPLLTLRQE
jgi:tetratricopeptide (TPR) repeat protein